MKNQNRNIEAILSLILGTTLKLVIVKLQAFVISPVRFPVHAQRTDAITKECLSADNSVFLRRSNRKLLAFQSFSCYTRGLTKPYGQRFSIAPAEEDVKS